MKKILLIATGGTIASKATENGLIPQISSEELLTFVPEVASVCTVDALQVCNLDSTNLRYPEWLAIARAVED
ncbi:MAG: asparaginase, partial [Clostridia bacterium]|nr:asparaginase [Clostridia bacterium]